jgi:hypothetical protein
MMKLVEGWDAKIPTWALSALINSDSSGLEDEDELVLDKWESFVLKQAGAKGCSSYHLELLYDEDGEPCEPYFDPNPEFGKACDVQDYRIHFHKTEPKKSSKGRLTRRRSIVLGENVLQVSEGAIVNVEDVSDKDGMVTASISLGLSVKFKFHTHESDIHYE